MYVLIHATDYRLINTVIVVYWGLDCFQSSIFHKLVEIERPRLFLFRKRSICHHLVTKPLVITGAEIYSLD